MKKRSAVRKSPPPSAKRTKSPAARKKAAKSAPKKAAAKPKGASTPKREGPVEKTAPAGRIEVENVNVPGYKVSVDAGMYAAMKKALLKVVPKKAPGITQTGMMQAVLPHLPSELFPGGAKAGWWVKCVHLDLEAKKVMVRDDTKPLTWRRLK